MGESPTPLRATDPATVGAYRLRGVLGVGGMGTVYLAADPDGRDVALKVINPALHGDPQFRHRFAAEAAAASRVAGFCTARVFCLLELRVENIGSGAGRVWLGSQHLRDADAKEYSPDELSWLYYDKTRPLLNEINPGGTVTGTPVFDVPAGVNFTELRVKEHPLSGGSTIRLR